MSSYSVTIRGKGIYEGTATGTFVVEPLRLTPPKPATDLVYNGLPQTGVFEGDNYTLEGNITETDADEYYATATVKDTANTCWENDSTTCGIRWSIKQRSASEVSISVPGSFVYNGSAHKPKPTVTWNGKPLAADEEYEVSSYTNNVNAGTATITIFCAFGNFEGTKTATFTIAPAPSSVGTVTAEDVWDSLDPADVVLARSDASLPGSLTIVESKLSYGTNTYHWVFTPTDTNYAPSSGTVEVTVARHEWSTPTYDQTDARIPNTSDRTWPIVPIAVVGIAFCAVLAVFARWQSQRS